MPVDLSNLPPEILLKALNLDLKTPEGLADLAAFRFAQGDVAGAIEISNKLPKDAAPEITALFAACAAFEETRRFEARIQPIEGFVQKGETQKALDSLAELKKDFPKRAAESEKSRLDGLAARIEGSRLSVRLKSIIAGEILAAGEDNYVELRYDFTKNNRSLTADFEGGQTELQDQGLWLMTNSGPLSLPLRSKILFKAQTLRAEFVVQEHNVEWLSIGWANSKARWKNPGTVIVTYEAQFSKGYADGSIWTYPDPKEAYRYVLDRTPDRILFLLDGKELASSKIDKLNAAEPAAPVSIKSWNRCLIKEIVIKGKLDPVWLKAALEKAGQGK
jgi:hypothetical protein